MLNTGDTVMCIREGSVQYGRKGIIVTACDILECTLCPFGVKWFDTNLVSPVYYYDIERISMPKKTQRNLPDWF